MVNRLLRNICFEFERDRANSRLSRWLFLRLLGLIYLIAFVSLWTQIEGLIGRNGILPLVDYLQAVAERVGPERYWRVPTFCWLDAGDGFLHCQCAAGAVLSLALIAGFAPMPALVFLWAIYLSLSTVCRDFLAFQWDILLLETGFLAIFLAPRQWLPGNSRESVPSVTVLWLCRWLLFRLMFMSGSVKLLSADRAWWNFSALTFHYETQPLPTWVGWYAHQFPIWFHKTCVAIMFVFELAVPFLIFCGRRARQVACGAFVLLMLLISLTGNYCFFNLLTLTLCVLLLDDPFWLRLARGAAAACVRMRLINRTESPVGQPSSLSRREFLPRGILGRDDSSSGGTSAPLPVGQPAPDSLHEATNSRPPKPSPSTPQEGSTGPLRRTTSPLGSGQGWARCWGGLRVLDVGLLATVILLVSGTETAARLLRLQNLPPPLQELLQAVTPLRTINSYGLFAVMTSTRPEIVVEGSDDGVTWLSYEFKWKPGRLDRAPAFVAPHQPRLDWQMWFAALGDYRGNPWFMNFLVRLLQGAPEVLGLLEQNPFPDQPPRRVRAVLYEYHFTDFAARRARGEWWRRERKGLYCPEVSLRQNTSN